MATARIGTDHLLRLRRQAIESEGRGPAGYQSGWAVPPAPTAIASSVNQTASPRRILPTRFARREDTAVKWHSRTL
jgi:hypothetical protein